MDTIYSKLDYPQSLFLECTNACSLKCSICPYMKMKRKKGFISWETLRIVIEESVGKSKVCFFMGFGEPLMHPEIFDMLEYIRSSGLSVYLSTNSVLLDDETIHKLFDAGLSRLYLPLSSMTKEIYEDIRVGADFGTVVDNIDKCIRIRRICKHAETKIIIISIAMKETINEFASIKRKYEPMLKGIGGVELKGYCTYGGAVENRAVPGFESPPGFCTMTNYVISIYWDGDISICCNDYDKFNLVWNVHDNSIEEIWNNSLYEEYRRSIREKDFLNNPFCGRCLGGQE